MELIDIIAVFAIFGFVILFILLPRYGPHYTSKLVCPNCKKAFNFHWIPGATLTSLRYGNRRRLKCPYCSQVNTFDIASTRVKQPKMKRKA
jgi:phage FluMu protein Com